MIGIKKVVFFMAFGTDIRKSRGYIMSYALFIEF